MAYFEAHRPLLPEILSLHAKWRGTQLAVSCESDSLNWKEFSQLNHQFANGLLSRGIQPKERMGIVMSNGIPMLQAMMGAMAAGIVSVPINLSVNDDALVNMLVDADVSALAVSDDQAQRILAIKDSLPERLKLIICDELAQGSANDNSVSFNDLCENQATGLPAIEIGDDFELNIIYSSGTTGLPKGIVHSQAGRRDWAYDLAIALRYHCSSKTLLTLGLYSNISWVAMLATLLAGGSLVIHKTFDAENFLETVEQENITHTAMVPVQFQRVIEAIDANPENYDTTSMAAMMSCGSPLHTQLKQQIFDYFSCGIIELYGLTEGVITTIEPEQADGRWSSVGKPLIGTDIAIVNDDDEIVAAGESGEVVSRGRITMPGYLNREDANAESAFHDKLGRTWLRTGDIGYVDAEGYLYIVDRKKDMILSGGQNIYPQDIEAVLVEHESVNEVAVIAAKSATWGETPIALVVRNESSADSESIKDWANQRMGKQQRIKDVVFIDEIPRNPNGKILKRELRKQFANLNYD